VAVNSLAYNNFNIMPFLPKILVFFPFLHKGGWLAVIYAARGLLVFGGGGKFLAKRLAKRYSW